MVGNKDEIENMCPLCGRIKLNDDWDSDIPDDPIELENQIRNLEKALKDLRVNSSSVLTYGEKRYKMCPMCEQMMEDMESEEDRPDLEISINNQIENLKEIVNQCMPGQL